MEAQVIRTRQQEIDQQATALVESIITPIAISATTKEGRDFGVDIHCELVHDRQPTGVKFDIQCKGHERLPSRKQFSQRVRVATLRKWISGNVPVMLVVTFINESIAFWVSVRKAFATERSSFDEVEQLTLRIPSTQCLCKERAMRFDEGLKRFKRAIEIDSQIIQGRAESPRAIPSPAIPFEIQEIMSCPDLLYYLPVPKEVVEVICNECKKVPPVIVAHRLAVDGSSKVIRSMFSLSENAARKAERCFVEWLVRTDRKKHMPNWSLTRAWKVLYELLQKPDKMPRCLGTYHYENTANVRHIYSLLQGTEQILLEAVLRKDECPLIRLHAAYAMGRLQTSEFKPSILSDLWKDSFQERSKTLLEARIRRVVAISAAYQGVVEPYEQYLGEVRKGGTSSRRGEELAMLVNVGENMLYFQDPEEAMIKHIELGYDAHTIMDLQKVTLEHIRKYGRGIGQKLNKTRSEDPPRDPATCSPDGSAKCLACTGWPK